MPREEFYAGQEASDAPKSYMGFPVDMENAELDVLRNAQRDRDAQDRLQKNRELMDSARIAPRTEGREQLTPTEKRRLDAWSGKLVRTRAGEVLTQGEWMGREKITGVQQLRHGDTGTKWYVNRVRHRPAPGIRARGGQARSPRRSPRRPAAPAGRR